jgi:signal transduction histidine kinase
VLKPRPDERDRPGRTKLRWLTVWAPVAFLALVMAGIFTLHPHIHPTWMLFLMALALAGGGAYLFSRFVFASIQRQEDEIVQRNRELTALNSVGEVLSRSLRIDEVLPRALETILEAIGVEAGEIFLWEEETGEMVLRVHRGLFPVAFQERVRFKRGEGFPGRVAVTGESIVAHDIGRDARFLRPEIVAKGFRGFASVPLKAKEKVLGVLNIAAFDPRRPTPEDVRLLTAVGHQLGMAIENFQLSEQLQVMAVVEERQRIAREMHDSLAQSLGYIHLRLADAQGRLVSRQTGPESAELGELKRVAREAYEEVRQAIFGLRTMVSRGLGLVPTLTEYLHDWSRQTGIAVDLKMGDEEAPRFSPTVEVQLIRIIQEALTNVRKHSGAEKVRVGVEPDGEFARVTIQDDGHGFDPAKIIQEGRASFGLATMRERAEGVGGKFVLTSQRDEGTTVEIRLPANGWREKRS